METKERKKDDLILLNKLSDSDLEELKGGTNEAIAGEEEPQDVDRGTRDCCNSW